MNTEENYQKFQFIFNKQIARNLHYSRNKDIVSHFQTWMSLLQNAAKNKM